AVVSITYLVDQGRIQCNARLARTPKASHGLRRWPFPVKHGTTRSLRHPDSRIYTIIRTLPLSDKSPGMVKEAQGNLLGYGSNMVFRVVDRCSTGPWSGQRRRRPAR